MPLMIDSQLTDSIKHAAALIVEADICAGAGMGVDSGLPDFRGNDGFWKAYPAFLRAGIYKLHCILVLKGPLSKP